jgi:hypothetical protein
MGVMMVPQNMTEARTRRMFLKTPPRIITRPEVLPIWRVVSGEGTRLSSFLKQSGRQERGDSYQEYGSNVEQKCHRGIQEQHEDSSMPYIVHLNRRQLHGCCNKKIHHRTNGRIVIQRHQGVHLLPFSAQ